jgi:hypothetical protein
MRSFNQIFIELEERGGRVARLYTFIDQKLFQS